MNSKESPRPIPLLIRDRAEKWMPDGYRIRESKSPQEAEALLIDRLRNSISMLDTSYHSPFITTKDLAKDLAELYALLDAFTRITGIDADYVGKIAAKRTEEAGDYTKMLVMEPAEYKED